MDQTVSLKEKKEFIRWFLKKHQMKRRECVWILNYYLSHDELLENLHFVEDVLHTPRSMMMSVDGGQGTPFQFNNGTLNSANAEKAFHELRMHPNEDMYIQLNFPNVPASIEYLTVLEENTFLSKHVRPVNEEYSKIAEELIEHVMKLSYQENLNRMIDEALDNGDKELFMQLTSQMVNV